ncbi:hypothetical protein HWI79_288 [Cryptosporidium felis]|nr:hypothetical protein HWI79_288 [Cryptosporidium felis]
MKLNFDFQGIFKSINLKESFKFENCASAYKNIKGYAANVFKSCEDDICLFLEGKPFVLSDVDYREIGNKLIRVRRNIESGLKGGKGGFGATIKSQKKKVNLKELSVGLCRDLKTGKRIKDLRNEEKLVEVQSAENSSKCKAKDKNKSASKSERKMGSSSSKSSRNESSVEKDENKLLNKFQSQILNLEDKWKNISDSVDFGLKNSNLKAQT